MIYNAKKYNKQSGNVLFLILIAVALFAALAYAVTQSTRSGGTSADREASLLNSAALTQYPASLKTSLIRMILSGVPVEAMEFNAPSTFNLLSSENVGVFHPNGGEGQYQLAPAEVMAGDNVGEWRFNAEWAIEKIGTDVAGDGNDVIAFLPGVSRAVCEGINNSVNIITTNCTKTVGNIPDLLTSTTEGDIDILMDNTYTFPTDAEILAGMGAACEAFVGQATGCFTDTDTNNRHVFYATLHER